MVETADRKAMGARIKTLRKAKGLPQKALAAVLGIRFEQLNKYEGGFNTPPVEMLVKIADALGTSVDYILTGNPVEDSQLANVRLFRRFQALENLAEEDRETVIRVIDAMIAQRRVTFAMASVD